MQGFLDKRLKGLEPSTFCMASRRSSQLSYSRALRPSIATGVGPAAARVIRSAAVYGHLRGTFHRTSVYRPE